MAGLGGDARTLTFVLALSLLAACTATYGRLRPVGDIGELAALDRLARELPNERGYVTVEGLTGDPVRVAYRHTRAGTSRWLVVLVHGLLSDRRAWNYVAGDLGRDHDLLLIDLPGCGASDRPDPEHVGPAGYSPTALARQVWTVVRARLAARPEPRRVALVGHSLGAMVILRMLGDAHLRAEYADGVERVERVVLLSPVDFAVHRAHPVFVRIAALSGLVVALGSTSGILKERVARIVIEGACAPERMPREEADRLIEILRDRARRRAAQAMIRQAVPFTEDGRPHWTAIHGLVADYGNVEEPTRILYGAQDETFSVAMGYKLRAQLPRAQLRVLKDAMHSLPSEAPLRCSRLIRSFLEPDGSRGPAVIHEVYWGEFQP